MAQYQLAERRGDRHIAGVVAGVDPDRPAVYYSQMVERQAYFAITQMIGGGLEDSTLMEIVNPATGHFFNQPGISASGGTDDPRP